MLEFNGIIFTFRENKGVEIRNSGIKTIDIIVKKIIGKRTKKEAYLEIRRVEFRDKRC